MDYIAETELIRVGAMIFRRWEWIELYDKPDLFEVWLPAVHEVLLLTCLCGTGRSNWLFYLSSLFFLFSLSLFRCLICFPFNRLGCWWPTVGLGNPDYGDLAEIEDV